LIEKAKETLCLKGKRTSQIITDIMKDLVSKPEKIFIDVTTIFMAIFH